MLIIVIGASGGEITGSCYVVQTKFARIMVDCGMFQGEKNSETLNCPPIQLTTKLDA